jgi:anti-sigma factor RsiW
MDCNEALTHLLAHQRSSLAPELLTALEAHLEGCERCRREDAADQALSVALERLPRRAAPEALKRGVRARLGERQAPGVSRFKRTLLTLAAAALLALIALLVWRTPQSSDAMVAEAVNDHLRVLYSAHPLDVESGGIHQVKPWFAGRLDFAPAVAFDGDDDFPLQGGAVAYFLDRKAAAFEYKRRLLWRDGELGYALVSDVNEGELVALGVKVAGGE